MPKISNLTTLIFTSEEQLQALENGTPGKGTTIDLLLIPLSIKDTWAQKYPKVYAGIMPCLNQEGGRIVYYQE